MTAKNTQKKSAAKSEIPSVTARIDRMVDYEGSKIKAFASVTIGGAFAVHGFKVYESEDGKLSVLCPATKSQKDGKYYEDAHPISADARTALNGAVLDAYEQRLHMAEDQGEVQASEAEQTQTM